MHILIRLLLCIFFIQPFLFSEGNEDYFCIYQEGIVEVCKPVLYIEMAFATYKDEFLNSKQVINFLEAEGILLNETVEGLLIKHFQARKKGDMEMMKGLFHEDESDLVEESYSRIANYPKALKKYHGLNFIGKTYFDNLVRIRYDMVGADATPFPMVTYAKKDKDRYWLVEGVSNNFILEAFGGGHPVNSSSRELSILKLDDLLNSKKVTFFGKGNSVNFLLHDGKDDQQPVYEKTITVYLMPSLYEKPGDQDEIKYLQRLIDFAKTGDLESIKSEFSVSEAAFLNRKNNPHVPMVSSQLNTITDVEYLFKLDGLDYCSIFYGEPKTRRIGSFVLAKSGNGFELNARKGNNWLNRIVTSSELMSVISHWQYKPE